MESMRAEITIGLFRGIPESHKDSICELLEECDKEFVPPLSMRESPWQTNLKEDDDMDSTLRGIESYAMAMIEESFLVATMEDGTMVAFLAYMPSHVHSEETEGKVTDYVSTICTRHEYRGRGIARTLYETFEQVAENERLTVRTWSTNKVQVHLLHDLGYSERRRIADDRGQGIDTLYFEKRRKSSGRTSCHESIRDGRLTGRI